LVITHAPELNVKTVALVGPHPRRPLIALFPLEIELYGYLPVLGLTVFIA
jgi:hypothetical protein